MDMKVDYRMILKAGRINKKWTQQEVADRVGISRSYYSDIENGRIIPSGKILFAINEVIPIFLPFNDVNTIRKEVRENA